MAKTAAHDEKEAWEYRGVSSGPSDDVTLALTPHKAVEATTGPDAQISPTAYVEMTRPDGGVFLSPLSNVEHYESKGFTAGAAKEIPDLVAYTAAQAHGEDYVTEQVHPDQSPEEVLQRMAGVPKTPEEVEAEQQRLTEERERAANPTAPTPAPDPKPQPDKPNPEPHAKP